MASLRLCKLYTTPHDVGAGNPVFERETRVFPWAETEQGLHRFSRRLLVLSALATAVIWLVLWSVSAPGYAVSQINGSFTAYRASTDVVFWLMLIAAGCGVLLDLFALRAGLGSISSEVTARRWELLRLTPLRESGIIFGKHAAAQIRAWRGLSLLTGLRVGAAAIFLLNVVGLPFVLPGMSPFTQNDAGFILFVAAISAVSLPVYILEPLWRVRAMTALGMVISSFVLHVPLSTLAALAVALAVWLLQLLVLFALASLIGALLFPIVLFSGDFLLASAVGFGFSLALAVAVYGFYAILTRWGLRRVFQRISRAVEFSA